ncbi:MAG: hypothetical protein ACHQ8D_17235, partial [Candidatus Rokuibacteriota bacterium]
MDGVPVDPDHRLLADRPERRGEDVSVRDLRALGAERQPGQRALAGGIPRIPDVVENDLEPIDIAPRLVEQRIGPRQQVGVADLGQLRVDV